MCNNDIDISANIFSADNSKIIEGAPNFIRNQLIMENKGKENNRPRYNHNKNM